MYIARMGDPRAYIVWTGSEADDWAFPDPVGFIWKELKQGRLRMGWAPPGASLVENGVAVPQSVWQQRYVASALKNWKLESSNSLLDPPKKVTTRYQILSRMLRLKNGDVLLVPRMPSPNEFTVARVNDSYQFDDSHYAHVHPDLGHVIPVNSEKLARYGYNFSGATRRISRMFQNYRSAITAVRKPEFHQLILKLAD